MGEDNMGRVIATGLCAIFVLSAFVGCLGNDDDSNGNNSSSTDPLENPIWEVGDWWLYTFVTPEFGEDSARLVVGNNSTEDSAWMLGISSEQEAQRHAVINHNPFLGRMAWDNLSVFENGEPQSVFSFPFAVGNTWQFSLWSHSWDAEVTSTNDGFTSVQASSDTGGELIYTFDGYAGFLNVLTWIDSDSVERLRMQLNNYGNEFTGDVFFIRAIDLYDEMYEGFDGEAYDTFFDSGHPSNGDFDFLVWYLDVEIDSGSSQGTLSVKDHSGVTPLARVWGPSSTEKGSLGTIPSNSGEYSVTATLNGGSSIIHLKMAGGLRTQWIL